MPSLSMGLSRGLLWGLGLACVVWTVFELLGLFQRAQLQRARARMGEPADRGPSARPPRGFEAWDQRGERLDVEEIR